jgi:protease I
MTAGNGAMKKRVAILLENSFEDSEFQLPYNALQQAGATTIILGTRMNDEYKGKKGKVSIAPDATAAEVRSEDFDAILIPGGGAPDKIRRNANAVRLVMDAMAQGKLIAAVCHGPQVLIEADQLRDKQATGFKAIRKDIQNAGATYINEPVVVDGNLITSRQPSDLPMFTATILNHLALSIEGTSLPEASNFSYEWWKLGESWGGSSKGDIVNALNLAIMGERYTTAAFKEYEKRANDTELQVVLREILTTKQRHVALLESRLQHFGEEVTWQAMGSEALATLQSWLQSNSDEQEIMRRALGDLQTGIVDSSGLCVQITDPATAEILEEIGTNLSLHEQRLAELYRARLGVNVKAPMPTTFAGVS